MNKIILGTVQMGLNYGVNNSVGKISIEDSHKILLKASMSGIKILDTAEAYGNAHQVIGDFHNINPDIKFQIVTKMPHGYDPNTISIESKVNEYLQVLRVDSLEVLMFHSFETFEKNQKELNKLIELKSQGLINQIGVSVYTNKQIEFLLDEESINVVQIPFNLLDNNSVKGDLFQQLKANGKIIHTRSAFLQGLFFKKSNDKNQIVQKLQSELEILKGITLKLNCSMEELALGYCIHQQNIDNVIIGVDSIEHLITNINAAKFEIDDNSILTIDKIVVKNLDLLNPSLWN